MVTKENIALQGIEYVIYPTGKRKAVMIDLERWGELWDDFYNTLPAEADQHRQAAASDEEQAFLQKERERALERLKSLAPAGIVLPTKPLQKATMPTIQVEGRPFSQIIIMASIAIPPNRHYALRVVRR